MKCLHLVADARIAWISTALLALSAAVLSGCGTPPPPPPEPTLLEVELLGVDPPAPARVNTAARLSLRIGYRSDLPIRFGATPLRGGMPVPAGSNPSPAWPAGEGEALAWFFLFEPGVVDAVRVNVGHANGRGTFRTFDFPVEAEFVAGGGATTADTGWTALLDRQTEALRVAQQPPPGAGGAGEAALGSAIIVVLFSVLILGAALPIAGIRAWRGGLRIGAWIALALYGLPILNVVVGVLIDSTSHNLWPLELFGWALASIVLCVVLYAASRYTGTGSRSG